MAEGRVTPLPHRKSTRQCGGRPIHPRTPQGRAPAWSGAPWWSCLQTPLDLKAWDGTEDREEPQTWVMSLSQALLTCMLPGSQNAFTSGLGQISYGCLAVSPSQESSDMPGVQDRTRALVPDHQLLEIIGRGSYGEVWLARHQLGILRAVKLVYRSSFDNDRPFQREFEGIQKFEPISRSHEGLVDILQVGGTEGCF